MSTDPAPEPTEPASGPTRARNLIAASVGGALVMGAVQWRFGPEPANHALLGMLYSQVAWVLIAFGVAAWLPGPVGSRLGFRKGRLRPAEWVLALLGLLCLSTALNQLLVDLAVRDTGTLAHLDDVVQASQAVSPLLAVIAIGLAPGVGEELLFRGLMQRTLDERFGGVVAVLVTAAMFGAVHLDPAHSPVAFVLGLYLGVVALLAGNVWTPMAFHVLNNLIGVAGGVPGVEILGVGLTTDPLVRATLAGILLASAFVLRRRRLGDRAP